MRGYNEYQIGDKNIILVINNKKGAKEMAGNQFLCAVLTACERMPGYRDELCKLDSFIGDGDHGITIERGFRSVASAGLDGDMDFNAFFSKLSQTLSANMGGAIGPIYGLLFNGFAIALKDAQEVDTEALSNALTRGIGMVMQIARVKPGEKTILDAMLPLSEKLKECKEQPLEVALCSAVEAGREGVRATASMVATKGRARFLKERSLGYEDPGAASFILFMDEVNRALKGEHEA